MRLTCKIAALNDALVTTFFETAEFAEALHAHFFTASNGAIELIPEFSHIAPILSAGAPASDGDLHFGMRQLTMNPSFPPIDTIGLLLGSSHANDDQMFGLMFDQGLSEIPGDFDAAVPREGAAVFVDTIARQRGQEEIKNELLFTAVHELGHAFNLGHAPQDPPTFMSRSAINDSPFNGTAFFFDAAQQAWLSRADIDFRVRPGESVFLDRDSRNSPNIPSASNDDGLSLTVSLRPAECTRVEPIHLDIRLGTRGGRRRRVARMLDPSHAAFRIFIEDPAGQSRLYASSVHCCSTSRRLTVTPSKPFLRDSVITTERGKYTFRSPGVHRVRVEFDSSTNCTIRSNVAEINVLEKPGKSFEPAIRLLATPAVTRLMQFCRSPNRQTARAVSTLIDSWSSRWNERQSLIAYRWSLAVMREVHGQSDPALVAQARAYLKRCRSLHGHRESRVEACLRHSLGS